MKRLWSIALVLAVACTGTTPRATTPSQSPSTSTSTESPPFGPAPSFSASRVRAIDAHLVNDIGVREDTGAGFRRAAEYLADQFLSLGYKVSRQFIPVPSGTSASVSVPAGQTQNVIATAPDYDPSKPHLVVGGHFDTVAVTRGANDNGSGAAMVVELARLARLVPTKLPVVWVEFGGEERRRPGPSGALFGSRYYVSHLSRAEHAAVKGMVAIDMVSNGPSVLVCHGGRGPRALINAMLSAARIVDVPAQEQVITRFFSDHTPFENDGIPVAWLWAGENDSVHTPRDTMAVFQDAEVDRIGRTAWQAVKTFVD